MEVKVLWSDTSLIQLHEIFDYLNFRASVSVARKIIRGIVEKSILLEANPLIGIKEPLLAGKTLEYRFFIENNYKIIYRFNDNIIKIVSIFDCRKNPQELEKIED